MAADNYKEILEDVCTKIQSMNSVKEIDITEIKNSVESIEDLLTDTQAKLNFQEIKDKLESVAYNIDSCNEAFIKNLYNDINELKTTFEDVGLKLENIQNNQNMAVTTAEFEEYQKQQLDLTLKTQENVFQKLAEIKTNSSIGESSENIRILEESIENLHQNLNTYVEQISLKISEIPDFNNEIKEILSNLNNSQNINISDTSELLKEIQTSISNLQSDIKSSDIVNQILKISSIYDNLNVVCSWVEKAGNITETLEKLYSESTANSDFNDVSDKINSVYENITELANIVNGVETLEKSVAEIDKTITSSKEEVNKALDIISSKLGYNIDFEDISDKVDIIYDNIAALNDWALKIDKVGDSVAELDNKLISINNSMAATEENSSNIDNTNNLLDEVSDKIDIIYENISALNSWAEKLDNVNGEVDEINQKVSNLSSLTSELKNINNSINLIKDKNSSMLPEDIDIVDTINKVDIIYDNLSSINLWAGKIDELIKISENSENTIKETESELHSKIDGLQSAVEQTNNLVGNVPEMAENLHSKIDDIKSMLDKTSNLVDNVPELSEKINEISSNMHSTLLDIESDFLKLHKFLDDNTQITSSDINSLKERFSELNDDISSISLRTNKLILTADDANKEFKSHLEVFKNSILDFNKERKEWNTDIKFSLLDEHLNKISVLSQNSLIANNNLNRAFIYLAEWVDASGRVLNEIQNDISSLISQDENNIQKTVCNDIKELKQEVSLYNNKLKDIENISDSLKHEDISELKSLLSGIIVQINTALNPNIDLINEKIEKLAEENNNKLKQLEESFNTKIENQTKQINHLTNKINDFNSKFDKLIEILTEDYKEYDMKDMLSYIVSEISVVSEYAKTRQASEDTMKVIEQKLSSFDTNINKIVSYIEED